MIPGANILNMALGAIGSQSVTYYRDSGQRDTLSNGVLVTRFDPGVVVREGSAQAIPQIKVAQLGLDVSKKHIEWIVPQPVLGVERDASGDEIEYVGRRYHVIDVEDWENQDGWSVVTLEAA
ncbi:phage collar protein [Pectobacterium polaris]|uniref:phage collar protein n=1 Tax=Pectobacterium polaris TaxID=2042057 RepID=UPI0032E38EAB